MQFKPTNKGALQAEHYLMAFDINTFGMSDATILYTANKMVREISSPETSEDTEGDTEIPECVWLCAECQTFNVGQENLNRCHDCGEPIHKTSFKFFLKKLKATESALKRVMAELPDGNKDTEILARMRKTSNRCQSYGYVPIDEFNVFIHEITKAREKSDEKIITI